MWKMDSWLPNIFIIIISLYSNKISMQRIRTRFWFEPKRSSDPPKFWFPRGQEGLNTQKDCHWEEVVISTNMWFIVVRRNPWWVIFKGGWGVLRKSPTCHAVLCPKKLQAHGGATHLSPLVALEGGKTSCKMKFFFFYPTKSIHTHHCTSPPRQWELIILTRRRGPKAWIKLLYLHCIHPPFSSSHLPSLLPMWMMFPLFSNSFGR